MSDQPRWRAQCDAARRLRQDLGSETALGYLLGEKFLGFLREVGRDPSLSEELPRFLSAIRAIFPPPELRDYFNHVRRVGALGHATTDAEYEVLRQAGAIDEDVVSAAEDAIRIQQMKHLLLGES